MLEATLDATPDADGVALTLTVENTGEDPVEMTFRDGQRAEFVARSDGDEVWRWSDGRMFTQAISTAEVDPGETVAFEAGWSDPAPGEYTLHGWIAAQDIDARDDTTLTV